MSARVQGPHSSTAPPGPDAPRRDDWCGLDRGCGTAAGFATILNCVDLLPGRVHAVPTRATAAAADAAEIIHCNGLHPGARLPDVLVVDHYCQAVRQVHRSRASCSGSSPRACARRSSSLIVRLLAELGSAYHKQVNSESKVERAYQVIGNTLWRLRAYAKVCKDAWDCCSSLRPRQTAGHRRSARRRAWRPSSLIAARFVGPAPACLQHADSAARESPKTYSQRMRAIEAAVRELLVTTRAASKARLDAGLVDAVLEAGDRVLLRTKQLSVLHAANYR